VWAFVKFEFIFVIFSAHTFRGLSREMNLASRGGARYDKHDGTRADNGHAEVRRRQTTEWRRVQPEQVLGGRSWDQFSHNIRHRPVTPVPPAPPAPPVVTPVPRAPPVTPVPPAPPAPPLTPTATANTGRVQSPGEMFKLTSPKAVEILTEMCTQAVTVCPATACVPQKGVDVQFTLPRLGGAVFRTGPVKAGVVLQTTGRGRPPIHGVDLKVRILRLRTRTRLCSHSVVAQVPELRQLLLRHGFTASQVKARKPGLLELVETLTDVDINTNPKTTDEPQQGWPVVVVLQVYDSCRPLLPVRAAISAVIAKDAKGLWFAVSPLEFRLVWTSSRVSLLGVLDIEMDPKLKAFMDPNDTKAAGQLVHETVNRTGSSGDFKADADTASGDASVTPEVKSSELRAANKRERDADKARGAAEKALDAAEQKLDGEQQTTKRLEQELAQLQEKLDVRTDALESTPPGKQGGRRSLKRKQPGGNPLPEKELEPTHEGISPTETKLIDNYHAVTLGILALANNMANSSKQQVSVAAPTTPPQLTTEQQAVHNAANVIIANRCAGSGLTIELMCDPLMTQEDLAPELAKIKIISDKMTVRRAQANAKALAAERAAWESRQRMLTGSA
jgi:hypothetical protein